MRHFLNGVIVLFLLLPGVFGDAVPRRGAPVPAVETDRLYRPRVVRRVPVASGLDRQGDDSGPTASRCTRISCVITSIAVAMSVLTATVSWYWLERPINRRRDLPFRQWFRPLVKQT